MEKLFANPVAVGMLDIKADENFQELLLGQKDTIIGALQGEMSEKDKLFNKLVAKRVLKRALITAVTAILGGELIKTAAHVVSEFVAGLFASDQLAPEMALAADSTPAGDAVHPDTLGTPHPSSLGNNHPGSLGGGQTHPDSLGNDNNHPDSLGNHDNHPDSLGTHHPDSLGNHDKHPDSLGNGENLNTHTVPLSETSKVNLPNGFNAETSGTHVTVTGPNGIKFATELNKDGTLSQGSLDALRAHGLNVIESHDLVQGPPTITHEQVDANQFVQNHMHEMKTVKVTEFMTNKDPNHSDLNEYGLQNKVLPDGNIQINIQSMTSGGSFHNGNHIDWHEAAKTGHAKIYMSASPGSQAHAFEVQVKPDGTVIVDKNTPAGALFDSHGKFLGGYERAAVEYGQDQDGVTRVVSLATEVGTHSEHLQDTISTPTTVTAHTYTVTPTFHPSAFVTSAPPPSGGFPIATPLYARSAFGEANERPAPPPKPTTVTAPPPVPTPPPASPGLPTAPAAASPNPAPAAPGALGSAPESDRDGGNHANTDAYDDNERSFINNTISAETRPMPPGFTIDVAGLNPLSQKLVIAMTYEFMLRSPRISTETQDAWHRRVASSMRLGARQGLRKIANTTPGIRPIFTEAFNAFLGVTTA